MLAVVAWVLITAGVVTSQGYHPPADAATALTAPYEHPGVASVMPSTQDVSQWYGESMTLWYQGPPEEDLYFSQTPAAWDLREGMVDEAWAQRWSSPEGYGRVTLTVLQFHSRDLMRTSLTCSPAERWDITGVDTAGLIGTGTVGATGCLAISNGRMLFIAEVVIVGEDTTTRARSALEAIAAAQLPLVVDSPDTATTHQADATRAKMLQAWTGLLLFAGLALTVPAVLLDKSFWLRLNPRAWRRRATGPQLDVEPAARAARARLRTLALFRFSALVWTLRLTEEVGLATLPTVLALVAAHGAGVLVQRWVSSRGSPRRTKVTHQTLGSVVVSTIGALLSLGLMVVAVNLLVLGVAVGSLAALTPTVAQWQADLMQTVLTIVGVWLLGNTLLPVAGFRRISRRLLRDKMPSGVPQVLLLRTFADDGIQLRIKDANQSGLLDHFLMKRRESAEQVAVSALSRYGAPVAVAQPNETFPPGMGARRLCFAAHEWQHHVEALSADARMICVMLGRSEGLDWELGRLRQTGQVAKTVFVVPPVPVKEQRARLALLSARLEIDWSLLDVYGTGRRVLAVSACPGRLPVVVIAASQDDVSYHLGIATCAEALRHPTPAVSPAPAPPELPSPRPPVEVVPSGASPKQTGAWKLTAAWNITIPLSVVSALAIGGPTGGIPQSGHSTTYTTVPTGHHVNQVVGGEGSDYWFVQDLSDLVHWDGSSETTRTVATLSSQLVYTSAYADRALVVATRDGSGNALLARHEVDDGRLVWEAAPNEPPPTLTIVDGTVWVPQPKAHLVHALSMADGSLVSTVELPCQPWSVTVTGTGVSVTCPSDRTIVRSDGSGVIAVEATSSGVSQVLDRSGSEWWVMPAEMQIRSRDGLSTITMSFPFPGYFTQVDARGDLLAVVGFQRVSVFRGDPRGASVERVGSQAFPRDLAVTADGRVLYSTDDTVVLLRPK